ncbi:hypothetical protein PRIPAC_92651 [Pristionchus pacificus]|uniref:Uncharacterized protein n=1 Tax=Pristionchus pacificus TaxID=54126 RepID=A0A2A6BIL0_PRIPA|nr:hypothetical protein PRIPAC_92651 [Pristionchus pacificus]|eukprot:PDM65668.1 hypothetical protein PRIPAC_45582 [Pristionchus pacificus]
MIQVGDTRRVAQADGRGFSKLGMEESGGNNERTKIILIEGTKKERRSGKDRQTVVRGDEGRGSVESPGVLSPYHVKGLDKQKVEDVENYVSIQMSTAGILRINGISKKVVADVGPHILSGQDAVQVRRPQKRKKTEDEGGERNRRIVVKGDEGGEKPRKRVKGRYDSSAID